MSLTALSAIEMEEVYLAELLNTYKAMVASKPSYKSHIPCCAVDLILNGHIGSYRSTVHA